MIEWYNNIKNAPVSKFNLTLERCILIIVILMYLFIYFVLIKKNLFALGVRIRN